MWMRGWTRQDKTDEPLFNFLEWCLRYVSEHPHYGVRNTIFDVIGLISRSPLGQNELLGRNGIVVLAGGSSAVAIPQDFSYLFRRNSEEEARFAATARSVQVLGCYLMILV